MVRSVGGCTNLVGPSSPILSYWCLYISYSVNGTCLLMLHLLTKCLPKFATNLSKGNANGSQSVLDFISTVFPPPILAQHPASKHYRNCSIRSYPDDIAFPNPRSKPRTADNAKTQQKHKKWNPQPGAWGTPDPTPTFHTYSESQESSIPEPPDDTKSYSEYTSDATQTHEDCYTAPPPPTHGSQGITAYRRGDYAMAIATFNQALQGGDVDLSTRIALTSNRAHAYEKVSLLIYLDSDLMVFVRRIQTSTTHIFYHFPAWSEEARSIPP